MMGTTRVGMPGWVAHPDVWLLVGLLAAGYFVAVRRIGPTLVRAGQTVVERRHVVSFVGALSALWIASDYPIHDISERYLYSVHMVQHLLFAMVFVPLLIRGTPEWLARYVLEKTRTMVLVQRLTRFFPAVCVFNVVIVVVHIPAVVSAGLHSGWVHFGLHTMIVLSGIIVWLPVLSPLAEVPRLQPPLQMLYLFLQSVVPTIPAAFLSYGAHAVYRDYEHFDRLWGISARSDQTIAALIMKTGSGLILWTVIGIVFFRWYAAEEQPLRTRRTIATPASQPAPSPSV